MTRLTEAETDAALTSVTPRTEKHGDIDANEAGKIRVLPARKSSTASA